jgi:hypothetical protein
MHLLADSVHVPVDGSLCDAKLLGDSFIRRSLQDAEHDLTLAPTQPLEPARCSQDAEVIHDRGLRCVAEDAPPLGHLADCPDEILG